MELDGVLVTVIDGGRLVLGGELSDGPSTTRVLYCERLCVCKLKLPSSRGKYAVPSQSSLNQVSDGLI